MTWPQKTVLVGIGLTVGWFAGCAIPGGGQPPADLVGLTAGMERRVIEGARFQHATYSRGPIVSAPRIHVYLEGDGLPWENRHRIATDPTPRDPLALRLMARDPTPAIYVGRPCYHGLATAPGCSPWLWTHGRYSQAVVESMAVAIARRLSTDRGPRVTLIGYSGGGVLAMLVAERLSGVDDLITVAANLDIDAWADHHGYSRLRGSLNPASRPLLDSAIRQMHLAGALDRSVPPSLIRPVLARNHNARFKVFPDCDHRSGWVEHWPQILADWAPVEAPAAISLQQPASSLMRIKRK